MKKITSIILAISTLFGTVSALASNTETNSEQSGTQFSDFQKVAQIAIEGGQGSSVAIKDNYAYVASMEGGVHIVDITDPAVPIDVTPGSDSLKGTMITESESIAVNGSYLYAAFSKDKKGTAKNEIRKYKISNPTNPVYEKSYTFSGIWIDIEFYKNYMYVADSTSGVKVYDLSDDILPILTYSSGGDNITGIEILNNYLYLLNSSSSKVMCYDISDPEHIKFSGSKEFNESCYIFDFAVNKKGIYMADKTSGALLVIDSSKPSELKNANIYQYKITEDLAPRAIAVNGDALYLTSYASPSRIIVLDASSIPDLKILSNNIVDVAPYYFEEKDEMLVIPARTKGLAIYSVGNSNQSEVLEKEPYPLPEEVVEKPTETALYEDIIGHWAKTEIETLSEKGIVEGVGGNKFAPNAYVTRAEFIAMISRAISLNSISYKNAYSDVKSNDWYADVMQAANNVDLIDSNMISKNRIFPNSPILREEAASVVMNAIYIRNPGQFEKASLEGFVDGYKVSKWANNAVAAAYKRGIILGNDKFEINPGNPITRAEAAAVILRATKNVSTGQAYVSPVSNVKVNEDETISQNSETPMLLMTSDEISPDEVFTIYGSKIYPDGIEIAISKVTSDKAPATPPSNATMLNAIETDANGDFTMTMLPENIEPGSYYVWVKNSKGWSKPIVLNTTRPLWLSENIMTAGNKVKVVGRNLDASAFGAKSNTKIILQNEKGSYEAVLDGEFTQFAIDFTIGSNVPDGEYNVYVSNDGIIYNGISEGMTMSVVSGVDDPYELGVGWAGEFNWNNIINVQSYGAKPNDNVMDTEAVQEAMNAAAESGGGVVYFPKGVYNIYKTTLPSRVVLVGDGVDETKLTYTVPEGVSYEDAAKVVMFQDNKADSEGRQGFINLTINSIEEQYEGLCGNLIWLGNAWGSMAEASQRTAEYFVFKNFKCDVSFNFEGNGLDIRESYRTHPARGGFVVLGKAHFLMDDCHLQGLAASFRSSALSKYVTVRDMYNEITRGSWYLTADYMVVENCDMVRRFDPLVTSNGMFTRGNCYVANNRFTGSGYVNNDGEWICAEPYRGGTKMAGYVTSATENTITVDPYTTATGEIMSNGGATVGWDLDGDSYGWWQITITEGQGMGQTRKLTAVDELTKTWKIDKNWDILPDETSKFTIGLLQQNITWCNNTGTKMGNALIPYGDTYDTVIYGNKSEPTTGTLPNYEEDFKKFFPDSIFVKEEDAAAAGTYTRSIFLYRPSDAHLRTQIAYFTRVEANSFDGINWRSGDNGMLFLSNDETVEDAATADRIHPGALMYGTEVKNNNHIGRKEYLSLPGSFMRSESYSAEEGLLIATYLSRDEKNKPLAKANIVEGNSFENSKTGISIGGRYNRVKDPAGSRYAINAETAVDYFVLKDNVVKNCDTDIYINEKIENITVIE